MDNKFTVEEGSKTMHCCFNATMFYKGEHFAEFYDYDEAVELAAILNLTDTSGFQVS